MSPMTKQILLGVGAFFLTLIVSLIFGCCSPLFAIMIGGAAGYFCADIEGLSDKGEMAIAGAKAGIIPGCFMLLAHIIASLSMLYLVQHGHFNSPFGKIPNASSGAAQNTAYYLGGLIMALVLGVFDIAVSAGLGAVAARMRTPKTPPGGPSNQYYDPPSGIPPSTPV